MNALAFFLAAAMPAQPAVARDTVGIRAADVPTDHARTAVQSLLSAADRQTLTATIQGQPLTLDLRPHSLRGPKFQLLVQDATGALQPQIAPPSRTYRGVVREWERSEIVATYADLKLTAMIRSAENGQWAIQPAADGGPHVVFARDAATPGVGTCGVSPEQETAALARLMQHRDEAGGEPGGDGSDWGPRGGSFDTEISVDADFEFFQLNGSSVAATIDDIETVLNGVDQIYRAEVGIQYVLNRIIVRTADPDPYTSTNEDALLGQFYDEWNDNHGGQERDVAHLFTGKDIDGNVIGYASVGVLCDVESAYGFSQSRFTSNMAGRVGVTAHELGHNWSATHCDGAGDCFIMCSTIGGCGGSLTQFGSGETNQIVAYRNSATCLGGFNNTVYVDDSNNTGSEDGSPASPYNTLREGLWAAGAGGTVVLRGGTYDFERTSRILNRPVRLQGEAGGGIAVIGQ
jgi:Metallo-peptidase family M12